MICWGGADPPRTRADVHASPPAHAGMGSAPRRSLVPPTRLALLALLCFTLPVPAPAPADDPPAGSQTRARPGARAKARARPGQAEAIPKFRYRGMTIDVAALWGTDELESVLPSLRRQIDITVDARVKPEIAEFFRSIPVALGPVPGGGPGFCDGRSVVMTAAPLPADRVVLLHELMHAYHHKLTTAQHRSVVRFHREAAQAYSLPTTEYFLTNVNEFFAVTASIHAHGSIPRAPGSREAIRAAQPEYARLLAEIFDTAPAVPVATAAPRP